MMRILFKTGDNLVFPKNITAMIVLLLTLLNFESPVLAQNQSSGPFMFVSSNKTNSIVRFNAETGAFIDDFIAAGSGGLGKPQEIIFGPDGHIYVTGFNNSQIKKYDRDSGEFLGNFTKNYSLNLPTKTTFHTDSLIYVSQWGGTEKVVRFNMNTGDFVDEFTSTRVINGMGHAWGAEGNLYVVSWGTNGSDGNVQKFDAATGVFQSILIPTGRGGLRGPVNIWIDNGELFVVDWTLGRVLRFNEATGAFNGNFITGLTRTEGFTFGVDGSIYLCDWQLNRVNRYDSEGKFLNTFATGGGMSEPNDVIFGPPTNTTSVDDPFEIIPVQFKLSQNFPNPFNPVTRIDYRLTRSSHVLLKIYNERGEEVSTLVNRFQSAGDKSVVWNSKNEQSQFVSSGIYFYKIVTDELIQIKKMLLLK